MAEAQLSDAGDRIKVNAVVYGQCHLVSSIQTNHFEFYSRYAWRECLVIHKQTET